MVDIWRNRLDGLRRMGLTMATIQRSINEGEKEKAGGEPLPFRMLQFEWFWFQFSGFQSLPRHPCRRL